MAPPLSERAKGAIASADQAVKEGTAEVLHAGAGLMGRSKVGGCWGDRGEAFMHVERCGCAVNYFCCALRMTCACREALARQYTKGCADSRVQSLHGSDAYAWCAACLLLA